MSVLCFLLLQIIERQTVSVQEQTYLVSERGRACGVRSNWGAPCLKTT